MRRAVLVPRVCQNRFGRVRESELSTSAAERIKAMRAKEARILGRFVEIALTALVFMMGGHFE
jgi:hypothetical protein